MKEVVVSVLWGREDWFDHVSPSQWKHMNLSLGKENGKDVLLFQTPTNKFFLQVKEIISVSHYDSDYGLTHFLIKLSFDRNFAFRFKSEQLKDIMTFIFEPLSLEATPQENLRDIKEAHNLHFVNDFTSESIKDLGQLVSTSTSVLMVDPTSSSLQRTFISFKEEVTICQVSTSNTHAIGITTDGRAFVWGEQKKHNPILGVGESDRLVLPTPVLLETPFDDDESVAIGVCGTNCSALISTRGRTSMWGRVVIEKKKDSSLITSNFLSLSLSGIEKEEEEEEKVEGCFETFLKPEMYESLSTKRVSSLTLFGDSYFAIVRVPGVDDMTEVFSWGWKASGLLGHGNQSGVTQHSGNDLIAAPLEIEALKNETVLDLSVSHTHVLAVNQQGSVFVWGKNSRHSPKGKVGGLLGPTGQESEDIIWHPTKLVKTFGEGKEEKAIKVAAGQNSSLALTQSRYIYTWGYSGSTLRLGLPEELLADSGSMAYQTQPTKVPTIRDIDSVQTNGVTYCMVTKSQKGGIFMLPTESQESLWTYIPPLDSSCVFDSNGLEHQIVTVQASCYAWVALMDQKRVISSLWHPKVSHLIAFVARTFQRDPSSFSLVDALGEEIHPEERTSDCIQRMIFADITPAFIVVDLETLMESLKGKVWLDGKGIQWASKEAILTLLYKYPQTAVCSPMGLLSQQATPFVRVGFHNVFFLTYKHLLKLQNKEVFDFLMKSYSRLSKKNLDGSKLKKEKWLPSSLSRSLTASIITKLPKTRMLRILSAIEKWLEIAPTELFGDKDLIRKLMNFLQSECENPIVDLRRSAIRLRGIVCLTISKLPRHISYGQPSPEGLPAGSVLLNFHPKYVAEHLLWIDACHLHRTVTVTDICHLRVPKLQPRHTNVANWIEKELLQCPPSSVRMMIDNVVELGYYLLDLRDFFSFSALSGAMYQRPIISLTEDVWGKGTKLSPLVYGHWKEMEGARERVSKPAKYQRYFEESSSPKVTFLGYSFNKLEMLNQKYKQMMHNNPPPESESELFLFEWARVQAELAFFWKKTLDDAREQISESFTPDPNLIQYLLSVKGFRLNQSEHRKIANSYRVSKTTFQPEVQPEEAEREEEAVFASPIQEADVEVVLLEGRAEFITLSDNLRREAWEEWLSRLQNELNIKKEENLAQEEREQEKQPQKLKKRSFHRRETAPALQNIGESELNVAQEWYRLEEELLPFREEIVTEVWDEGTFGDLFLSSEALEVSLRDLVKSRPREHTLRQFQSILECFFPYPGLSELMLSAIFEIADYEEVCVSEKVLKGKYKEVATEAIYHFIKCMKTYHLIFFNFEDVQEKFCSFLGLLQRVEHLSLQADSKDGLVENVIWSVFTFVDHAMNGSDEPLTPFRELIDPLTSLDKLSKLANEIGKLRSKKDIADFEGVLAAAKLLEETLKEQMATLSGTIETKKGNELSHSMGTFVDFQGFGETLNTRATLYQRALRKKERSPVGSSPLEDLVQVMQGDLIPMIQIVVDLVERINKTAVSALKSIRELAIQTTQASYQKFTINKPRMDHEKDAFGVVLSRMMRLGLEIEDKEIFEQNEELTTSDTSPAFSLLTLSHSFSLPSPPSSPFRDHFFKDQNDPKVWACLPQKVNTSYRINKSVLTPTHLWFCCKNGSIGCLPLSFADLVLEEGSFPPTPTFSSQPTIVVPEKTEKAKEKKKKSKKRKEKDKGKEKEEEEEEGEEGEEGGGEDREEGGEEGVILASDYWFVDERSNIKCIEYCPETNKIWTADLKGTIQVWAASPVSGIVAAKQETFLSEIEFRPHHSFFSHWSKDTLELKDGALRWGKHHVILKGGEGGVERVGVDVEGGIWKKFFLKMMNGDSLYFRSPTPETVLTWVQKILKCLDLSRRSQTLLEISRIESTEKSMDRIMSFMTVGGRVWGVDSMWKVVEFIQEKNNTITIKHLYNLQSIIKEIMVPEVGKSLILQKKIFVSIGDSLVPLPLSTSPPPSFPPPLLRMEKTTNVLISVIFVPKYGNNYEIWAADLGGNLTIWDSNTKDCLFEFLWAKNESEEFVVKNQSDKKCFWNWGWDPHDFVSTMTYFNQEVYIGTSRGAIFRISTTSRQIVPNSINQNAHSDEISSINHFQRGGTTLMVTGCFDCSFSLWELSKTKKSSASFIKK